MAITRTGIFFVAVLFAVVLVRAHDETPGGIENYLHGLVDSGENSTAAHRPQLVVTYQ